ncbi:MAG: hypothetical protein EZS28_043449, partial [Streblomastix strix]
LLPYTSEKNQQQRQSQRSISPTYKKVDEYEDDEFLDAIIPGMTMPHLPPHVRDIESAQRIWQNRGYDLVKDPSVIKYKNSKWHYKLASHRPFTFRDWREFWSDVDFSLEQINIPHYLSKEYKSQSLHDKSWRNESIRIYERERQYAIDNGKGLKRVVAAVAAAVAVAIIAKKQKNIGQAMETRQFREPMGARTAWRMMNATDKQRKRDRSNSIETISKEPITIPTTTITNGK